MLSKPQVVEQSLFLFMNECEMPYWQWVFLPDHLRCWFFARRPRPDEQQPLTEGEKAAASAGNAAAGEPTQEELMNLQEPMEMD